MKMDEKIKDSRDEVRYWRMKNYNKKPTEMNAPSDK